MSRASLKDEPSIEDILAAIRRQIADEQRATEAAEAAGGNGMWADEPADLCAWAPWPEALDPPADPANDDADDAPAGSTRADGIGAKPPAAVPAEVAGRADTVITCDRRAPLGRSSGDRLRPANDRAGSAVSTQLHPVGHASRSSAVCAPALALVRQAGLARQGREDHSVEPPGPRLRPEPRDAISGGVDIGRISAAELLDLGNAGTDQMQALLKAWLENNMPRLLAEALGHDGDLGRAGLRHG